MRVFPTHIVAGAGVVLNEEGKVLLVKVHNAGWVFPGGQVENGENIIDAVKREIMEESGITVEVEQLFCISSNTCEYPGYNGIKTVPTKVMMDFVCRSTGGTLGISEENSESGWYTKDEAEKMITAPSIIKRFNAYLEFEGQVKYLEYVTKPEFELKEERHV